MPELKPESYAEVAIPATIDRLFTYAVPRALQQSATPGARVHVPFGKRKAVGFIVTSSATNPAQEVPVIKDILSVLDPSPIVSADLLKLARWMAGYYFAPLGDVLRAMTVEGASAVKRKPKMIDAVIVTPESKLVWDERLLALDAKEKSGITIRRVSADDPQIKFPAKIGKAQARILRVLAGAAVPSMEASVLLKRAGASSAALKALVSAGSVQVEKKEVIRTPSYNRIAESEGNMSIVLNKAQEDAVSAIRAKMDENAFHAFLLHGVTGSGKTQVYIEAIRHARALGKTAIVLVPEISLTPQTVRRFHFHFGESVAVFHSRMTAGERFDAWRLAAGGRCSLVIGPRSAIFAPLKNLGIIVVDEEHEATYKQFENAPLYHARDVALMRGRDAGAAVVLGSATPSFESYANALAGKYTLLELPYRIDDAKLPRIEIVNMGKERQTKLAAFSQEKKRGFTDKQGMPTSISRVYHISWFSDLLRVKIADRLERGEGIILLQNRRGFAPFIECLECGKVEMCDQCNISLTYHAVKNHLRCHYCGRVKAVPKRCENPECGSAELERRGVGTQRVEEELTELFPEARVARMDLDTTASRGAHDAILKRFGSGDVDILLGTQMVAKGLDFARVTLVGVIDADTQMLLPDFRSAERTFQLLSQVSGRAGRSAAAGEVVLQTFQPLHPALKHVLNHDFRGFYEDEIGNRNELNYPPHARLALIEFSSPDESESFAAARAFRELLNPFVKQVNILGPAPASISKIRNRFRHHIILKSSRASDPSGSRLHNALRGAVDGFENVKTPGRANLRMHIDVDPAGMM